MRCLFIRMIFLCGCCGIAAPLFAQAPPTAWKTRLDQFLKDPALRYASVSLMVTDLASGKRLASFDPDRGLPAASTQKIFTSMAALDILGPSYRFHTQLVGDGPVVNGSLEGNLQLVGTGDPSLGSWRYTGMRADDLLQNIVDSLQAKGISRIKGNWKRADFSPAAVPNGWIWQDMGNYYGAAAYAINWRENQYDLLMRSGKTGEPVAILQTRPALEGVTLLPDGLTAGPAGSGDNAYIYLAPGSKLGWVRGTIPPNSKSFEISGSLPDPAAQLSAELFQKMQGAGLQMEAASTPAENGEPSAKQISTLWTHYSPRLDSLNHWFLRRSINLYGEALLHALATAGKNYGDAEAGISVLHRYWQERGIDSNALSVLDGSGLSPQNRITTGALVQALVYARGQSWYNSFYEALPTYNGMKLKSGSIGGVRAFAGYHQNKAGQKLALAIIVNNYTCSDAAVVQKIFRLLDYWK